MPTERSLAPLVDEPIPQEVVDALLGVGLVAGGANVIMQLSRLPVGHGVAKSTVDSGRVDKHPFKRLRTTTAFLVVSMLGSAEERAIMRREINRAHTTVHSAPGDPVPYNAFDSELQLWVAACLYKGLEDGYRLFNGGGDQRVIDDVLYPHARRFGTTLQVREDQWPTDRAAFEEYWQAGVASIEMDDLTRSYLQGIAQLSFLVAPLPRPLAWPLRRLLRPIGEFMTIGCLPQEFRDELGLPWSGRKQRAFDRTARLTVAIVNRLPASARKYPLNVYLADTRKRIRAGRPVV